MTLNESMTAAIAQIGQDMDRDIWLMEPIYVDEWKTTAYARMRNMGISRSRAEEIIWEMSNGRPTTRQD